MIYAQFGGFMHCSDLIISTYLIHVDYILFVSLQSKLNNHEVFFYEWYRLGNKMKPSFTLIISAIFLAYIAHSMYVIYGIFFPEQCKSGGRCIYPYLSRKPTPKLEVGCY